MTKNKKRILYLSGILLGIGALKIYKNQKNKKILENYEENHCKEEKYTPNPEKGYFKKYTTILKKTK